MRFCFTWYEELGLVEDRQLLLTAEPLNDARHLQVDKKFAFFFGKMSNYLHLWSSLSPYLGALV